MNLLRLSTLFLAPALAATFALACGEISDPTKGTERTATVSGALTGTSVPAGARVAVVWRNGANGGVVVGAEADIVGGKFTMTLAAPADAYFYPMNGEDYDSLNAPNTTSPGAPSGGGTAPADPAPVEDPDTDPGGVSSGGSTSGGGGSKVGSKLGTRGGTISGGITEPLSVATAGFVVYVDANGNGTLDLEGEYSSSPDTIIGGNKELILAYLKGGGQLDYEKLRDKSGILPVAGFNLAWDQGRWIPLTLVELQLSQKVKLPSAICSSYGTTDFGSDGEEGVSSTGARKPSPESTTAPDGGYPPKGAAGVYCYDGGHSFYYTGDCPPPPPPPVGLCASDYGPPTACASPSYSFVGDTPPAGWPCDVDPTSGGSSSGTGGTPMDAGVAVPADSGTADGGS
jgi:hypothetical protein